MLELGSACALEQLEGDDFSAGYHPSSLLHHPQTHFPVRLATGTYSITDHAYFMALRQQIQRCLEYTNMCLSADQNEMPNAETPYLFNKGRDFTAAESQFGDRLVPVTQLLHNLRCRPSVRQGQAEA